MKPIKQMKEEVRDEFDNDIVGMVNEIVTLRRKGIRTERESQEGWAAAKEWLNERDEELKAHKATKQEYEQALEDSQKTHEEEMEELERKHGVTTHVLTIDKLRLSTALSTRNSIILKLLNHQKDIGDTIITLAGEQ